MLWNQLGSSNKSGIKGWSEKGVYDTLEVARGIPDIDAVVRSDTGGKLRVLLSANNVNSKHLFSGGESTASARPEYWTPQAARRRGWRMRMVNEKHG